MSRVLRCLGLRTGSENSTLKIYVKLSKRHIWALPLSEIKKMKCDTFPLFHFKKSFKSYWVLIQWPNAIGYQIWRHLHKYSWMMPFRGAKLMVCATPFRGQFGSVCTLVGSTYVWEWSPREINLCHNVSPSEISI